MTQITLLKSSITGGGTKFEWDPDSKEPWHLEFEKEPVNDKKWSCIVTAAVPTEAQNQEYIQIYNQCINQGLRKSIKVITMDDVIRLLKGSIIESKSNKKESVVKNGRDKKGKTKLSEKDMAKKSETVIKPNDSGFSQIIDLAAKYAVVTDGECKLPPDLMAGVLKYLILKLKDESVLRKKMDIAREKKTRERNLKMKFIRNLKPYQKKEKEVADDRKFPDNILRLEEPINDEPVDGPDLYVLLVDFYDLCVFTELKKINVLFLAILEISVSHSGKMGTLRDPSSISQKGDTFRKKKSLILSFWEKHNSECNDLEKVASYKEIATMKYEIKIRPMESNVESLRAFFNELSWTIYSVYILYRQHQKYLQELYVQRLIVSQQPLDLSTCVVYNKLCDAVIIEGSLTPMLVLYAMIEQVVAGVPETHSQVFDYQPQPTDFFFDDSEDLESSKKRKKQPVTHVTPYVQSKNKKSENICEKLKENISKSESLERNERTLISNEFNELSLPPQNRNLEEETTTFSPEYIISESILDQQSEKDFRNKKKWEAPSLCFFGDSIFLQTSHCQPRLFNTETLVERFLKNSDVARIWEKYPELQAEDKAFYNFHFDFLRKISEKSEELLKLHLYFSMLMKLIGTANSFTYRGYEENLSELEDENERASKVQFGKDIINSNSKSGFGTYFIKTFIFDVVSNRNESKKTLIKMESEILKKSKVKTNLQLLNKVNSRVLESKTFNKTSNYSNQIFQFSSFFRGTASEESSNLTIDVNYYNELNVLYFLLDCSEISDLTHPHLINNKEEYMTLIQNFKFYEKLEPYIMLQRLHEAQNDFNMTQSSYCFLTDTVFIIMCDNYDHRGISFTKTTQILPTPVHFRDFYSYVYKGIIDWLNEEFKEQEKFVRSFQQRAKAEADKSDSEYLNKLNQCYNLMNEEEKEIFLETGLENATLEVTERDLGDLPLKPKPHRPDKISFVATNLIDLRVEFTRKIHEFKSSDGTEVNVKIENWLYASSSLLRVRIKLLHFQLYYNQWLEQRKIQTSFTLKTKCDIIFSFYKNEPEEHEKEGEEKEVNGDEGEEEKKRFNYHVTVSWPIGLIIHPVTLDSTTYIRQSYLKTYRKDSDIKEETSRNFVRNGQVVIFYENGGYDILCPSGTKHTFFSANGHQTAPKHEITSTTGEVWDIQMKDRCKNKKSLLAVLKIFIGVDAKAEEIFYKREDGVYCLLSSNGKLVTTFPDGTKITTTPDFDENEISVEWSEEELFWLKNKSERSTDKGLNRSSIRNMSFSDKKSLENDINENFVSVSCSYLIEHPKYSSVYFNSEEGYIRLKMPEDLTMYVYPGGNYVLEKENTFLKVCDTIVEVYKKCSECSRSTTVNLFLYENETLCKCVDVFNKVFLLYRNGKTEFEENDETIEKNETDQLSTAKYCIMNHDKSVLLKQRCFALERDLSGVEFLHADSIARYFGKVSENSFFDINTDDPSQLCHTFTCPQYKIGFENWAMKYENKDDSLPTNLKKKDLKEIGVKEVTKNLFKYPFPGKHNCGARQQTEKTKENIEMPKIVVARTIWAWPGDPHSVIDQLKPSIENYQSKALDIYNNYKNHTVLEHQSYDSRHVMMRLRKIALTLNQSLQMYPHLCTQYPSTEKEIHYFGHFINTMGDMRNHFENLKSIPDCKQIPIPLPRASDFPSIYEEPESPRNT